MSAKLKFIGGAAKPVSVSPGRSVCSSEGVSLNKIEDDERVSMFSEWEAQQREERVLARW